VRLSSFAGLLSAIAAICALSTLGCGASEESTEEWESTPTDSPTARLEYRADSLTNENRRMKDQIDALSVENRNLTARNAELETRLNEAMASPKATPAPATAPSSGGSNADYEAALSLVRKKDFTAAIQQFDALLKGGIQEDLAGNCHYWIGESYYAMRKYDDAQKHFEMVFDYKRSHKKEDAQLMIGNCLLASGNKAGAKEAYQKLVSNYPGSPLAKKAQDKLAKLQ
jgi:tol-pal system protein YbgF